MSLTVPFSFVDQGDISLSEFSGELGAGREATGATAHHQELVVVLGQHGRGRRKASAVADAQQDAGA